jgi:hypothetical protein
VASDIRAILPTDTKSTTSQLLTVAEPAREYLFLNYAIKNWKSHTSHFSEDNTAMWGIFKNLAIGKPMPFDIRIWGNVASCPNLPYQPLFRWAINAGHVPLLKLLLQLPAGFNLHAYCNQESEEGRSIILSAARSGRAM